MGSIPVQAAHFRVGYDDCLGALPTENILYAYCLGPDTTVLVAFSVIPMKRFSCFLLMEGSPSANIHISTYFLINSLLKYIIKIKGRKVRIMLKMRYYDKITMESAFVNAELMNLCLFLEFNFFFLSGFMEP